jgi:hypothetical protein
MNPSVHEAVTGGTPAGLDLSAIEEHLAGLPGLSDDGSGGGEYGQRVFEAHDNLSRKIKHSAASAIPTADRKFFPIAADFILNAPPSVDAPATVTSLLEQRLARHPKRIGLTATIRDAVMFLAEEIKVFDQTANLVVDHLDRQTSGQPPAQYQLLQLLTHAGLSAENAPAHKQAEVLLSLTTFAALKPGRKDIVSPIRQNLETGLFDSFIADEILHEAFRNTADPKQESNNNELLNLVVLVKSAAQLDNDEVAIGRLSGDLLELWPANCSGLLADRRGLYEQKLAANFSRQREEFVKDSLIISREPGDTLDLTLEHLLAALPRERGSRPTAHDLVQNASLKRKRLSSKTRAFGQAAVSPTVETTPEVDYGPRNQVMHMDAQGHETPFGTPEFTKFVDDYVQRYKGTPGLAENLQAMIDYLRMADFSKGPVDGIKKYKNMVNRGDTSYNLYAFKPSDAAGVPVSSMPARKTRMLFVRPADEQTASSNKLSLLAIIRRDDVPKYEKSLGIRSAARR